MMRDGLPKAELECHASQQSPCGRGEEKAGKRKQISLKSGVLVISRVKMVSKRNQMVQGTGNRME